MHSVSVVEELSRRAREAATSDLALYDALEASQQQYAGRLAQAWAIRDQAQQVHERGFGQEAKHAAEPVVAEAERVVRAFTELADAWEQRASMFMDEYPDILLLLAERRAQEEQTRQAEALAARDRRLRAFVAECQEATRTGRLHDGRLLVESIEPEFPTRPLRPTHCAHGWSSASVPRRTTRPGRRLLRAPSTRRAATWKAQ